MQAFIKRKERMELFKRLNNIHTSSVYDIGSHDTPWIEVNTFQMNFIKEEAIWAANSETFPRLVHPKWRSPTLHNQDRLLLKNKIAQNHAFIREMIEASSSTIIPRTQAHNRKCAEATLEDERQKRADIVAEQIKAWRSLLPNIKKVLYNQRP